MDTMKIIGKSAREFLPAEKTLGALAAALPGCRGCDICLNGTRPVLGAGPVEAKMMLVGEQPGDQEERQGLPFVGPAGMELDEALAEVGIPRAEVYVTNAVKHFKFVERGKRRLHETPRMGEVTACRPWLTAEIEIVRPRVLVCLGANASKSLLGSDFSVLKDHGKPIASTFAEQVFATIHPSAILRAPDQERRIELQAMLRVDLGKAWASLGEAAAAAPAAPVAPASQGMLF